jgi:DNA-binding response OmpR family regulator
MRIVVNTENYEILNSLIRGAKEHGNTVVIAKLEKAVFDHIESEHVDAFVLRSDSVYAQKAVDFIKRDYPYIPVLIIGNEKYSVTSSDIMVPYIKGMDTDFYAKTVLHNIYAYTKNFETLQRLTAKMGDLIEFGNCTLDPVKRILFYKGTQVFWEGNKKGKLSPKQAGVFELLAANFGDVVRKDVIMERVWHTNDNYFVGRSLDVFVTHLRKILKTSNMNMTITNVSNIGLMLDHLPKSK